MFPLFCLNLPLFCKSYKPRYLLSYPKWFFFSSLILLEGWMKKILEFLSSASMLKFIPVSWLHTIPFLKLWAAQSLHITLFSLCLEIVLTLKAQCAKPTKKKIQWMYFLYLNLMLLIIQAPFLLCLDLGVRNGLFFNGLSCFNFNIFMKNSSCMLELFATLQGSLYLTNLYRAIISLTYGSILLIVFLHSSCIQTSFCLALGWSVWVVTLNRKLCLTSWADLVDWDWHLSYLSPECHWMS